LSLGNEGQWFLDMLAAFWPHICKFVGTKLKEQLAKLQLKLGQPLPQSTYSDVDDFVERLSRVPPAMPITVSWINKLMSDIFLLLRPVFNKVMTQMVVPKILEKIPAKFRDIEIDPCELGSVPPKIGKINTEVREKLTRRGPSKSLHMTTNLEWDSDLNVGIKGAMGWIKCGLKSVKFSAKMHMQFVDFLNRPPFFSGMQMYMSNPLEFDIDWTGALDVLDLDVVESLIHKTVNKAMGKVLVLPARIGFAIDKKEGAMSVFNFKRPAPVGLFKLKINRVTGLRGDDFNFSTLWNGKRTSDPYVFTEFGGKQWRTATISDSTGEATWEEEQHFFYVDEPHDQKFRITIFDDDFFSGDDPLAKLRDIDVFQLLGLPSGDEKLLLNPHVHRQTVRLEQIWAYKAAGHHHGFSQEHHPGFNQQAQHNQQASQQASQQTSQLASRSEQTSQLASRSESRAQTEPEESRGGILGFMKHAVKDAVHAAEDLVHKAEEKVEAMVHKAEEVWANHTGASKEEIENLVTQLEIETEWHPLDLNTALARALVPMNDKQPCCVLYVGLYDACDLPHPAHGEEYDKKKPYWGRITCLPCLGEDGKPVTELTDTESPARQKTKERKRPPPDTATAPSDSKEDLERKMATLVKHGVPFDDIADVLGIKTTEIDDFLTQASAATVEHVDIRWEEAFLFLLTSPRGGKLTIEIMRGKEEEIMGTFSFDPQQLLGCPGLTFDRRKLPLVGEHPGCSIGVRLQLLTCASAARARDMAVTGPGLIPALTPGLLGPVPTGPMGQRGIAPLSMGVGTGVCPMSDPMHPVEPICGAESTGTISSRRRNPARVEYFDRLGRKRVQVNGIWVDEGGAASSHGGSVMGGSAAAEMRTS